VAGSQYASSFRWPIVTRIRAIQITLVDAKPGKMDNAELDSQLRLQKLQEVVFGKPSQQAMKNEARIT